MTSTPSRTPPAASSWAWPGRVVPTTSTSQPSRPSTVETVRTTSGSVRAAAGLVISRTRAMSEPLFPEQVEPQLETAHTGRGHGADLDRIGAGQDAPLPRHPELERPAQVLRAVGLLAADARVQLHEPPVADLTSDGDLHGLDAREAKLGPDLEVVERHPQVAHQLRR